MRPDRSRFQRMREIYAEVVRLDDPQRRARLDELCREDREMHAEIQALLGIDQNTALDRLSAMASTYATSSRPEHIGPYSVVDVIGRGGMGVVYRARQSEPIEREVAIKLIQVRASAELKKRFDAERQTLARLDHVNIAKVYDAGSTEEGEPYLVMELIDGSEIDIFCDHEQLSTRERVRLLVDACRGVEHAHQRGIIHRDLKPSNLLVSRTEAGPRLRIIDFGIARIESELDEHRTLLTQHGQILGTPEYMSPEQAAGDVDALDVRSDLYSLGVVLYRLLTGRLPYDLRGATLVERARIISTEAVRPFLPSSGSRSIDTDLETITRKALEKDPEQRYSSVSEFAADLERYLGGLPISARPPSTTYHLRKFVHRNPLASSLIAALFVVLVGFGVGMALLAASQTRALRSAERERGKSDQLNEFLQNMLTSVDPAVAGHDVTVLEILDSATEDILADQEKEPAIRIALSRAIARAYTSIDEFDQAMRLLGYAQKDLRAAGQVGTMDHVDLLDDFTTTSYYRGDLVAAEGYAREAIELLERNQDSDPIRLGRAISNLGFLLRDRGRLDDAEAAFRRSTRILEVAAGEHHRTHLISLGALVQCLVQSGKFEEALALARKSHRLRVESLGRDHTWSQPTNLVKLERIRGNYAAADSLALIAQKRFVQAAGEDSRIMCNALYRRAMIHSDWGRAESAERLVREAIDGRRELAGPEHWELGNDLCLLAETLRQQGRTREAHESCDEALRVLRLSFEEGNPALLRAMTTKARIYLAEGDPTSASRLLSQVLAQQERKDSWEARWVHALMAQCLHERGDETAAEEQLTLALELNVETPAAVQSEIDEIRAALQRSR